MTHKHVIGIIGTIMIISAGLSLLCRFYQPKIKTLSAREQAIAQIAANTAAGKINKLKTSLNFGLNAGLTINDIKELLIQQYAYAGFPRALNGINAFIQVIDERKTNGIKDEHGVEGTSLSPDTDKNSYGAHIQEELIGAPTQGTYKTFTPAIDTFLKEHLFADIFGRGVLSYQEREIATISALSSLKGTDGQLHGHIQIGLHIGLSASKIEDILTLTKSCSGKKILKQILKKNIINTTSPENKQ